ncbi:MAG TPA: signal peptide peptidase SppA [Salinivirgaceae bacterium]|nr:signal peptide peptidase SppA [Salinivirgaceae bacterium]
MKTFFRTFLATLLALFLAIIVGFFLFVGLITGLSTIGEKQTKVAKPNSVLVMELNRTIVDRTSENFFDKLFGSGFDEIQTDKKVGLNSLLAKIKSAKEDENIRGILIRPELLNAGMATVEELRNALIDFKSSGKFVFSYADFYTQKGYYLASASDKIFLNPVGNVVFTGLSAQIMLFKNTLKKLGVEPQVIRHGKFKSAVEPFILDEISPENRLQTATFLTSMWKHMLVKISESRGVETTKLQTLADNLILSSAQSAFENKIVDSLIYFDELKQFIVAKTEETKDKTFPNISIYDYEPSSNKKSEKLITEQEKIAVIYAQGEIGMRKGSTTEIGTENIAKAIEKARNDEKVKAIVLRINSPGGSALTSEIILREALLTKGKKPLIISMGDVAASGGYYIACAADTIVAQPTTITGSIGVFGLLFNAKELLNSKLGINISTVSTAKNADFGSPFRQLSAEEKNAIQQQIEFIYKTFVNHVAKARNKSYDEIDNIGQGRVWSGIDAKSIGLVDVYGGLYDAIAIAAEKARISDYRIEELPEVKDPFEQLFNPTDDAANILSQNRWIQKSIQHFETLLNLNGINARLEFDFEIY